MQFFHSLDIARKLAVIISGSVVLAVLAVGIINYVDARSALRLAAEDRLSAILEGRKTQLTDWLSAIEGDLTVQSENPLVKDALRSFKSAWAGMGFEQQAKLQKLYITENPHPTGQKEELDFAKDGSYYSAVHQEYHPYFRSFLRDRGYYDIFLFDPDGNLIYTVFKELDYATNLNNGQWADSELGNAFRAARDSGVKGSKHFFDFRPYGPSHGAPASFISTPILSNNGTLQGVLVFQMPVDSLNKLMTEASGLGESGETFLVGSDYLMRSNSRLDTEDTILGVTVDTHFVREAFDKFAKGDENRVVEIGTSHRGDAVIAEALAIEFKGTVWVIVAEQKLSETLASAQALAFRTALICILAVVAFGALGLYQGRSFASPIRSVAAAMNRLSSGNTNVPIPAEGRLDEIGEISSAFAVFKRDAIEKQKLEETLERERSQEARERERQAIEEGRREEKKIVSNIFGTALKKLVSGDLTYTIDQKVPPEYEDLKRDFNATTIRLKDVVTEIQTAAGGVKHSAAEISQSTDDLASRTEEQASNLERTTSAMEQMTETVTRTAQNAASTDQISTATRSDAQSGGVVVTDAVKAMSTIEKSSQEISEIVSVIDGIAFQTNLLALNAAVEAARAGDAGKGFAVVASEVQALAQKSGHAAKEIKTLIESSDQHVKNGVKLVGDTGNALTGIVDSVSEIASLITEIASASQEQAEGLGEVNAAVSQMDQATQQNAAMVEQTTAAARSMSNEAQRLTELIGFFDVGQAAAPAAQPSKPSAPVVQEVSAPRPTPIAAAKAVEEVPPAPVKRATAPQTKAAPKKSAEVKAEPAKPVATKAEPVKTKRAAAPVVMGSLAVSDDDWTEF